MRAKSGSKAVTEVATVIGLFW